MRLQPHQYPAALQHRARAEYASGDGTHAEGVIVGYADQPTFLIVTGEGRLVPWMAHLTDVDLGAGPVSNEDLRRHATMRRIRDGRDNPHPETKGHLPRVTCGMSLARIVDAVVRAGYDLNTVSFEYDGCGSHDFHLEEDTRSAEEIHAELAEKVEREETRKRLEVEYAQRMAEAEAEDADSTRGWE